MEHFVNHSKTAANLPNDLKKAVAKSLKAETHDLAVWKLADDGWREVLKARLTDLQQERNKKLNTPKTGQIDELFVRAAGINGVSSRWYWNNMPAQRAKDKLDGYVSLRGEVAHRGRAATTVRKTQVLDYYSHVKLLVGFTDNYVNRAVRNSIGVPLFGRRVARRPRNGATA